MTLRENFCWNFLGRAVYAACQWGILVVIAKMGNPDMVGKFGLGLALTAPVFAFTTMDLRSVVATDVTEQHRFSQYFSVRGATNLLSLVFICVIVISLGYSVQMVAIIMIIATAKAIEASSDVVFGLMQQHERLDYIAKSSILKGISALAAVALLMHLTRSLLWATASMALAWGALFYLYDLPNARRIMTPPGKIASSFHFNTVRKIVLLALPLGIAAALNSLNTNIPRYFIEAHHGSAVLGYFVALSYILLVGDNINNTLGQAAIARLARTYRDDLSKFLRLLCKLMAVGLFIGIAGVLISIFFGTQLLTLLYAPDYARHINVFIVLMVAGLVTYVLSFLSYAMIAARHFKVQMVMSFIVVTACSFAAWLLIPSYGLMGAALTTLIVFTLKLLLATVVLGLFLRAQARQRMSASREAA